MIIRLTIIQTKGSAPNKLGAMMWLFLHSNSPTFQQMKGTIGGGKLELIAIQNAILFSRDLQNWQQKEYILGPDLEQCCGGSVTVLFDKIHLQDLIYQAYDLGNQDLKNHKPVEVITSYAPDGNFSRETFSNRRRDLNKTPNPVEIHFEKDQMIMTEMTERQEPPVVIFGAGHIGQALAPMILALNCPLIWYDQRQPFRDQAMRIAPQADVRALQWDHTTEVLISEDLKDILPFAYIMIMTHDHKLDLTLSYELLSHIEQYQFLKLAVLGSETKAAKFRSRLKKLGVTNDQLACFECPIGEVRAAKPNHIAALLAAQLVMWQLNLQ